MGSPGVVRLHAPTRVLFTSDPLRPTGRRPVGPSEWRAPAGAANGRRPSRSRRGGLGTDGAVRFRTGWSHGGTLRGDISDTDRGVGAVCGPAAREMGARLSVGGAARGGGADDRGGGATIQ